MIDYPFIFWLLKPKDFRRMTDQRVLKQLFKIVVLDLVSTKYMWNRNLQEKFALEEWQSW